MGNEWEQGSWTGKSCHHLSTCCVAAPVDGSCRREELQRLSSCLLRLVFGIPFLNLETLPPRWMCNPEVELNNSLSQLPLQSRTGVWLQLRQSDAGRQISDLENMTGWGTHVGKSTCARELQQRLLSGRGSGFRGSSLTDCPMRQDVWVQWKWQQGHWDI